MHVRSMSFAFISGLTPPSELGAFQGTSVFHALIIFDCEHVQIIAASCDQ